MLQHRLPKPFPAGIGGLLTQALGGAERGVQLARNALFKELGDLADQIVRSPERGNVFEQLLAALQIEPRIDGEQLARIPAKGPLVLVANHPFGLLEGAILAAFVLRVRPDVKAMANFLMPRHEAFAGHFILVDPYGNQQSVTHNQRPILQAVRWLRDGGALIVFPAGDVSYPDWKRRASVDAAWNPSVARLIRAAQATTVPVYFHGSNSASFQLLGLVHPRLRTLRLPAEFMNKRGRPVDLQIGKPVAFSRIAHLDDLRMIQHLRACTYLLAHRPQPVAAAPIPAPRAERRNALDIPSHHRLTETKDWAVYCFPGHAGPAIMEEIGRLREETFRAAGEGTGQPLDLDRFDPHYDQLVLWNKSNQEIAGGYRLGRSEPILRRVGLTGLYTSTLFRYHPRFFAKLGPAIELGRSFVVPSYQRQYTPLLALWQGIGAYVCRHPECRFLFGAVSVSREYQDLSRHILAATLLRDSIHPSLARLVQPRHSLGPANFRAIGDEWRHLAVRDEEELSSVIASIEPDGKGLPVLLRQYLRLGGRLLAFSVDRGFSNVLDGLIVVDLLETEPALLDRYFTKTGAAGFRSYHQALDAACPAAS